MEQRSTLSLFAVNLLLPLSSAVRSKSETRRINGLYSSLTSFFRSPTQSDRKTKHDKLTETTNGLNSASRLVRIVVYPCPQTWEPSGYRDMMAAMADVPEESETTGL